jgi:hypothetical protein
MLKVKILLQKLSINCCSSKKTFAIFLMRVVVGLLVLYNSTRWSYCALNSGKKERAYIFLGPKLLTTTKMKDFEDLPKNH